MDSERKEEDLENQVADLDRSPVLARWARVESELDDVQDYVNREKRSVERRISKWAGVAALLISIVVGGFAIIDNIFLSPKQRQERDLAQLRDIILQIGRVNLEIASRWIPGDESMTANLGLVSNSIKLPLMSSAVEIIEKHIEHVPVFALMAIIPELSQALDYDRAIELARDARERAQEENNIAVAAEFTRLIAGAHMGKGSEEDMEKARSLYIESIDSIKETQTLGATVRPWLISYTIRDWSRWEATYGKCVDSIKIFERLSIDVEGPVSRAAQCAAAQMIIGTLTQLPCNAAGHKSIRSMMEDCNMR